MSEKVIIVVFMCSRKGLQISFLSAVKGLFVLLNLFFMFYAATSQKLKHWLVLNTNPAEKRKGLKQE